MNTEDEKYFVCLGMKEMGGSFVKALGEALSHADPINTSKIIKTWPELWTEYFEHGQKIDKKQNE